MRKRQPGVIHHTMRASRTYTDGVRAKGPTGATVLHLPGSETPLALSRLWKVRGVLESLEEPLKNNVQVRSRNTKR